MLPPDKIAAPAVVAWTEAGQARSARWRSESGVSPPKRVIIADDTLKANDAYQLACEGTAMLWRGDFQNARQLLVALAHRADRSQRRHRKPSGAKGGVPDALSTNLPPASLSTLSATDFHLHRQAQSQRARTLGMLLVPFASDHSVPLRRAPDVRQACAQAYGAVDAALEPNAHQPYIASLRELLGIIGAHEWRTRGVPIAALRASIHPHYGVFAPIRNEYVGLVATAPLPALMSRGAARNVAFDIGTGTGVLAAVLVRRGIGRVVATELDPRALACARENLTRLGVCAQVELMQVDLFPEGRAPLVVCNPPWIPARPNSPMERAVYDPESRMLRGFLSGLAAHLEPEGEGWLILSDLAEHFGLRSRGELLGYIEAAGLEIVDRMDARPNHPRVYDSTDPLHAARAAEVTSLWRLAARG